MKRTVRDGAALEQRHRIVDAPALGIGRRQENAWPALAGLPRQRLDHLAAGLHEGRLEHQILGRVAGDIELGKEDEVGAAGRGIVARRPRRGEIGLHGAHGRIELRERDGQTVGHAG